MAYQRRWAVAGLVMACILVIAVAIQGRSTHLHFVEAADRERQTLETLSILGELHGDFSDAETVWRGYLLSNSERHLRFFYQAREGVTALRTQLRQVAHPDLVPQIDEFERLIIERLDVLSSAIADDDGVMRPIQEQMTLVESGMRLRERTRTIAAEIEQYEKRRLEHEHEAFRTASENAWWGFVTGTLLAAVLLLSGGSLLIYELRARELTEQQLQESHRLLEQRVAERTSELTTALAAMQQEVTSHRQTAESLHQSESRFRLLVEVVQDYAIYMLDPEGMIVTWNRGAERLKGYSADEVIGTHFSRFYLPDEWALGKPSRQLNTALQTGRVEDEGWRLRKDGSRFWAKVVVTAIRDHQEKHIGYAKITRDLTQQKEAESSLRDALEFNRQIVSSVGEGMVALDRDLRILVWNPAMEKMLAINELDVLGKHLPAVFPVPGSEDIPDFLQRTLLGETVIHGDRQIELPESGVSGWFAARHYPLRNASDDVVGIICLLQDVSEKRRQQEAIRRSESRLRAVVQTASDAVITFDESGSIETVNPATELLFGYTSAELTGRNIQLLIPSLMIREQQPAGSDTATPKILRQPARSAEVQAQRRDHSLFPCDLSVSEYTDGATRMFAGIVHDLTERRSYEARLMRAQRLESVGALAGGIAHDLNNVLTPILIAVRMLRRDLSADRRQELLDTATASVEHGIAMIRQLLAFAGGTEGAHTAVDIRQLLSELQALLQHMLPRSVHLEWSAAESIHMISADPTQLRQVLINLCVNARDAMPDGGNLTLTVENVVLDADCARIHPEAQPGDYLLIRVADTGSGIPDEVIERVFDPFFTTKPFGQGTGLGLSMVQGIVKGHKGFVNVASEHGKGTTFSVFLPAAKMPANVDPASTIRGGATNENPETDPRGHGETILVVDDERAIRTTARTALEDAGYAVLLAADGEEALELIDRNAEQIRVVVLDMMMPRRDGPATLQELHRRGLKIPVIAVSGLPFSRDGVAEGIRPSHFLRKPYSVQQLLQTVNDAGQRLQ